MKNTKTQTLKLLENERKRVTALFSISLGFAAVWFLTNLVNMPGVYSRLLRAIYTIVA